ncbi:Protein of unknown function (DUF3445) domain containing protein [Amanita muscaria]
MFFSHLHSWSDLALSKLSILEMIQSLHILQDCAYFLTAVLLCLLSAVILQHKKNRSQGSDPSLGEAKKKAKDRSSGEWTPIDFKYPAITPCNMELADIKPIPYRPFRWGPYHVTMGIRSMNWDDWIELDNQYDRYQRIRAHRILTRDEKVVRVLDDIPGVVRGGGQAAIELVHELAEYLSKRYPLSFRVTRHSPETRSKCQFGWEGAPPIKTITVVPLNATHELPLDLHDGECAAKRAMTISALLVQDDLAIMIEGRDGRHYFQAGAICVPGFWQMEHKIGKTLDEIHLSGHVPQYQEKLQPSLERFFRRLSVDKPVVRNNYFIQLVGSRSDEELDPDELAWSYTTNGPEDGFEHGDRYAPHDRPEPRPEILRLRTERQTLRRLPKSGAVIFTIRTYVVPIEELVKEAGVAGRLASAIESWPDEVVEYKGRERLGWRRTLMEYLERNDDIG